MTKQVPEAGRASSPSPHARDSRGEPPFPALPTACPHCEAVLDVPYACPACGALLKEPPCLDHFARLGIAPAWDVLPSEIEKRWLELSRRLHPDRQLKKSPADRTRALLLSAGLNEAYATLRDPVRRAEYLHALAGGVGPEDDRRTPPGFLEEMLDLREALEETKAKGDRARLEGLLAQLEPRRAAALDRVRGTFERCGVRLEAPGAKDSVRIELNALKYLTNIVEELRASLRK